jgi:tripartite-type tricarboxylate transporter receptor subunit TctC
LRHVCAATADVLEETKLKKMFAVAALALAAAATAQAQNFPTKPIRLIVPNPAGGTVDLLPRLLGEKLQSMLGQPIIVDNRPGAAGNIGAEMVYRAEPDGHTLLVAPPPALVVNQNLYPKLGFDPSQFVPVTIIATVPNALFVNPKVPANNLREFVAYAKANGAGLNYGSQGSGSTSHLTAELFKSMAGASMTHVPYKGSAPALNDLIAGQIDVMFDNLGASMQYVKGGKLKLLGVGSATRIRSLPDVPAISESLPGFVAVTWFGVVAPPGTPPAIAQKLQHAFAEAMKDPKVAARMREMSAEPSGTTPADTASFMKEEAARWKSVIQNAGVKLD